MLKVLQDNLLQATGIPNNGDLRRPIPDCEWHDLKLVEKKDAMSFAMIFSQTKGTPNFFF